MRRLWKRQPSESEETHAEINKKLDEQHERLGEMGRRLRRLEIEAGIYKPPLRGVKNNRVA
jgi:hypothetical protein